MNVENKIAKVASLIGDKTRSAILIALMEGRVLTAGELALRANISPQTASNHLKKLMNAELIEYVKTPTRYRYYKISSSLVAEALESLSLLSSCDKKRPPRHDVLAKEINRVFFVALYTKYALLYHSIALHKRLFGLSRNVD